MGRGSGGGLGAVRSALLCAALLGWVGSASAQGIYMPGLSAQNNAMAGASTAAPVDAAGANVWNPAAIAELPDSAVTLSTAFMLSDVHLASSVPPIHEQGSTRSDAGAVVAPAFGLVYHVPETDWTLGFSLLSFGGSANFPSSTTNPLLSPALLGSQYSDLVIIQLNPSIAYRLGPKLSLGLGPIIDAVQMSLDPAYFATPNIPHDPSSFPSATHSRPFWGAGVQAGLVYAFTPEISAGLSIKSPQWLETFEWNAEDAQGKPRTISLAMSLPTIVSTGVAYRGLEHTLIELDFRYFNWEGTDLWGDTPVTEPSLRSEGLGWRDVFAIGLGAQYELSDRVALRGGYLFNTNPIGSPETAFNVQVGGAPVIQNTISLGGGFKLFEDLELAIAWQHGFENSVEGPIQELPPGSTVELKGGGDIITFGGTLFFGGSRASRVSAAPPSVPPVCEPSPS